MTGESPRFIVPDDITPIRGLRQWELKKNEALDYVYLQSTNRRYMWTSGTQEAACLRGTEYEDGLMAVHYSAACQRWHAEQRTVLSYPAGNGKFEPIAPPCPYEPGKAESHAVPEDSCGCGFWAVGHPRHAISQSGSYVLGVVELWGRVVVGTEGWRGQFARIAALIEAEPPRKRRHRPVARLQPVAEEYGVPILPSWREANLTPLEA